MDDQQKARAEAWLQTNWTHRCPRCGAKNWLLYPQLGQIPNLAGPNTVPVLLITCVGCSDIAFVNAVGAGILTPADIERIRPQKREAP